MKRINMTKLFYIFSIFCFVLFYASLLPNVAAASCGYSYHNWFGTMTIGDGSELTENTTITPSSNDCAWEATTDSPGWINITTGTNYIGTDTVTYIISENDSGVERTGTITIAGETGTIIQEPCFSGCVYADVSYDILDYYPLTPGYVWTSKDGRHKQIIDHGHNMVDVTRFYSGDSPTSGNIMAYDADYLYIYSYYRTDSGEKKVFELRPVLKYKRNIHIGESIGSDFAMFYEGAWYADVPYSRTLIAVEDVTTPAGIFKDCLKFSRVMNGLITYEWWARGVGMVKSIGQVTFEVASYNFDASSNPIPGGHNAVPSQPLEVIDFPTSVNPANNQFPVGACDDAMIQPTLAVPSSDVGKTSTLIMYIYLPDVNFGMNVPSKTKVLTSETKFDLLSNAIDLSDSAGLNVYIYYGYMLGDKIKYNAYSIVVGSSCSNQVPDCGSITDESSCSSNVNCEWQDFPNHQCILKCSQFTDEAACNAGFNGGCEWNSLLGACGEK